MLNEDNKSILDLVNYIDSKIVTLRNNNKFSKNTIDSLSNLYNLTVGEWMNKNYISDKYLINYYENKKLHYENMDLINKLLENKFKKKLIKEYKYRKRIKELKKRDPFIYGSNQTRK